MRATDSSFATATHRCRKRPAECVTRRLRFGIPILVAAAILLTPLAGMAQITIPGMPGQAQPRQAAPNPDLQRYNNTVVRLDVRVPDDATSNRTLGPQRSGTGVVLDEHTVLTIGYVTLEADAVMVTTASGRRIPASVAGYDHATGFGLVRTVLPMDATPVALGDSDKVSERQRVLTLGHGEPEATELVVLSRKPFAAAWEYLLEKPIFTFPPVNNWSGAALYDNNGAVIGIGALIVNDAASGQPNVPGNLYVPVNLIKPILGDLLAKGRRTSGVPPWLGITTEAVRGNLMVVRVTPNGPAESAGVVPGDIVLGVGPDNVKDQADFYRRVHDTGPAGVVVPLKLLKGGNVEQVPIKSIDRADMLTKARGI
jgi:serine protease Do